MGAPKTREAAAAPNTENGDSDDDWAAGLRRIATASTYWFHLEVPLWDSESLPVPGLGTQVRTQITVTKYRDPDWCPSQCNQEAAGRWKLPAWLSMRRPRLGDSDAGPDASTTLPPWARPPARRSGDRRWKKKLKMLHTIGTYYLKMKGTRHGSPLASILASSMDLKKNYSSINFIQGFMSVVSNPHPSDWNRLVWKVFSGKKSFNREHELSLTCTMLLPSWIPLDTFTKEKVVMIQALPWKVPSNWILGGTFWYVSNINWKCHNICFE